MFIPIAIPAKGGKVHYLQHQGVKAASQWILKLSPQAYTL
jgi:hypothetical protein